MVCFFTIFGGGRSHYWSTVCQDKEGIVYEVDRRTISPVGEQIFELRVRTSRGKKYRIDWWYLDVPSNTLRVEGGQTDPIGSGSVASRVILFLKQRGKLPKGNVPIVLPKVEDS